MLARSPIPLLVLFGLIGCTETTGVTGVQLTMHYGANTPDKLRVVGTTLEGRVFGPSLMPDPPRRLEANRESVMLRLPESMDGVVLAISVAGLDKDLEPQLHGTVQTEIVRNKVQTLFVLLTSDRKCPSGTHLSREGDCIRTRDVSELPNDAGHVSELPDDAGNMHRDAGMDASIDAGTHDAGDASSTDAVIDAGHQAADACTAELCADAAPIDPPLPDAAIEPPPPPVMELSCDAPARCQLECPAGAECDIRCGDVEECKVICGAGARCVVECASDQCKLECAENGRANACSGNTMVCNRECPVHD